MIDEFSMSYEELQYDIVKEALEDGFGQSKQNRKDRHHVQKYHLEIKQLDDIIKEQGELIMKL